MAGKSKAHSTEAQAANEIYEVARADADREIEKMKEREGLIAQCHEIIGQFRAVKMISKFADVSSLVWLKQIKDSKIYKDLPGIGTWEEFCGYLGVSRQKIDEDILNIEAFGQEFLTTVSSLRVGYRDLRKLRRLTHDGTVQVVDDAIEISGERIPLDSEHREDLQAAIEWVIDQLSATESEIKAQKKAHDRVQEDTRKSMVKLQRDLDRVAREAKQKDLTPEEDAFLQQIENLQTTFMGYMLQVRSLVDADEVPGPRAKSALIAFLNQARMELNAYHDTAYDRHASPGMAPEEEWIPPFQRQEQG